MKKNYKNIKEQSERIKSLFNEERLFGNLVEQSTNKECKTQLEKDGYEVIAPYQVAGKYRAQNLKNCLEFVNPDPNSTEAMPTSLGKLYLFIKDKVHSDVEITFDTKGSECVMYYKNKTCTSSQDQLIVSIYGGNPTGLEFNLQVLVEFTTPVGPLATYLLGKIKYARYEGKITMVENSDGVVTGVSYSDLKINAKPNGLYSPLKTVITAASTIQSDYAEDFRFYSSDGTLTGTMFPIQDILFELWETGISSSGNFEDLVNSKGAGLCRSNIGTYKRIPAS